VLSYRHTQQMAVCSIQWSLGALNFAVWLMSAALATAYIHNGSVDTDRSREMSETFQLRRRVPVKENHYGRTSTHKVGDLESDSLT